MKERADEERREKRNKLKERKDDFRRLLESAQLTGKSTFSDFSSKFSKDDRFKNIEKMRERESLFDEYLLEVRRKEKEEKIIKREQVRQWGDEREGRVGAVVMMCGDYHHWSPVVIVPRHTNIICTTILSSFKSCFALINYYRIAV